MANEKTTKSISHLYPNHPGIPDIDLESISIKQLVNTDLFKHHARCHIITLLHHRNEIKHTFEPGDRLYRAPIDVLVENEIISLDGDNQIDNFCEAYILWFDKQLNISSAARKVLGGIGMTAYERTCIDIQKAKKQKEQKDEKSIDKGKRKGKQ